MYSRSRSHLHLQKRIPSRGSGLIMGLVAVLLVVSCAPGAATVSAPLPDILVVTEPPNAGSPASTEAPAVVTEAPAVQAAVTSRGDALEATDPSMVNLASGGLQLVEFFRFT